MPYQVTFVQYNEGVETKTTGIVTKEVKIGDEATLVNEQGWWTVVEAHELPWVPIHKWDVGGVTTRRS